MTRMGLSFRILALAGIAAAGWFAALFWQNQPSVRSAMRLLFRPAAGAEEKSGGGILTLNGIRVSIGDLRNASSLRVMLTRIRDAAPTAPPLDAEQFLIGLMDQLSGLSPADLRSLALDLAKDPELLKLLDETSRALGLRLLSQDLEQHLMMTFSRVVRRDPDRMLLLAEALPPSRTRDDFLGRTLSILAFDRPGEVIALLNVSDPPLKDQEFLRKTIVSALHTLAARSFDEAVSVWGGLSDPWTRKTATQALLGRINAEPEKVFAWIGTLPPKEAARAAGEALQSANPETARTWLEAHGSEPGMEFAFASACGSLAKLDPAAALDWIAKQPETGKPSEAEWLFGPVMAAIPLADLMPRLADLSPERQSLLLGSAFKGKARTASELMRASEMLKDPQQQNRLATAWAQGHPGDIPAAMEEAKSLPPGPLREAAVAELGSSWTTFGPEGFGTWLRSASKEDQDAAMARAHPAFWRDPQNATFLAGRPALEQLPWIASIYRNDSQGAAGVIEEAASQGADSGVLDKAAAALAQSWQDRDPATARAFALSLPDPAMADRVLLSLAANSASAEARAAATAAVQDPVNRQQAERAAALKSIGISGFPGVSPKGGGIRQP